MKNLLMGILFLLIPQFAYAMKITMPDHSIFRPQRVFKITDEITPGSLVDFMGGMIENYLKSGPTVVIIDSPGGEVDVGQKILSLLLLEKERTHAPLVCIVDSDAHSMAFNILSFCDKRYFTGGSTSVVHNIRATFPSDSYFTSKRLREIADAMDKENEPYRQQNAKMMHLSLKDYDEYSDKETRWDATTLLKMGYYEGEVSIDYENKSGGSESH